MKKSKHLLLTSYDLDKSNRYTSYAATVKRCVQSSGDVIARCPAMLEFYACIESCAVIVGAFVGG